MRAWFLVLAPSIFVACGGGGPSPAALAYALPDPALVTYVVGDTADMDIDAGGQSMQARTTSSMTVETSFTRSDEGVQVWLGVQELRARQTTPMGSLDADGSGIDGPLVFSLDREGNATVVSVPDVSGDAVQFFQPLAVAHSLFPGLPGRAASVGESWTDTVRFEGEQSGGTVSSSTVLEYTVVGDTVVAERSLVRLDFQGTSDVAANGIIQGSDFSQSVSGNISGWVLWDHRRNLLVEAHNRSDARGSMEISVSPYPLGLRVRQQGVVRLQEGG
jgi:hypothetical protein